VLAGVKIATEPVLRAEESRTWEKESSKVHCEAVLQRKKLKGNRDLLELYLAC